MAYEYSFFFSCTKYPGCSFLNNPNFYQFGQHFPIQNNSKSESANFSLHMIPSKFCAYLNYLQNTVSKFKNNLLKTKNRTPFQGGILLTSLYYNTTGFSNPFIGEFTKYPGQQIFSNFLNLSPGETFTKPGMASTSTQNRLSQLHKYAKVYTHSSDKPPMCEIPDLGLKF